MQMESFPPLMFAGLVLVMLIGFPVAFSLAALGLGCGVYAIQMGWFPAGFMGNLPLNVLGILSNDLLLAIPFFTLMGAILEKCGLAEDMLDSMGQLFGPIKGGLGYSVIIVGFILGAITGTVAGQVIAMAMISLPVMMRYGYNMRYATGVLAASGTITQLVPPSLVLVVLADQLGKPVGDMYKGAWGPSILQIAIFALYTFAVSRFRPDHVPGVPKEARTLSGWQLVKKCLRGIIPSAVLIFAVLGSMGGLPGISTAICTPTEAGAMGAVGAFILAAMHGRLNWPLVKGTMMGTMRITAMVVFILIGSRVFSLVFQGVEGGKWIEHMLLGLPGGQTGFLIAVNIFIFFLAFFLDFFEIAFIILTSYQWHRLRPRPSHWPSHWPSQRLGLAPLRGLRLDKVVAIVPILLLRRRLLLGPSHWPSHRLSHWLQRQLLPVPRQGLPLPQQVGPPTPAPRLLRLLLLVPPSHRRLAPAAAAAAPPEAAVPERLRPGRPVTRPVTRPVARLGAGVEASAAEAEARDRKPGR